MAGHAVERARAKREIDAFGRQIENLVAEFDLDLKIGVGAQEFGQARQDARARE